MSPEELQSKFASATAFYERGELSEAKRMCAEILQTQPVRQVHGMAMNLLGIITAKSGDVKAALDLLDIAAAILPGEAAIRSNRGSALTDLGRPQEAIESFDTAIRLRPDFADAYNNRGRALLQLNRHEEALESYEQALRLNERYVEALYNRGTVLRALNRPLEAIDSYQKATLMDPEYADAHWNESICRLLSGDFEFGFPKYEWRWRNKNLGKKQRNFDQPLWLGKSPLTGKTILVHAEQGFGDTVQFCRYAKLLSQQGAIVYLEVQPELRILLQNVTGATKVIALGEALPDFDVHCPLLSLPHAMGTRLDTIPSEPGYIRAGQNVVDAWNVKLGEKTKPRIGVAWSGYQGNGNDKNRSIALAKLIPLLSIEADFVSLQKDVRHDDLPALHKHKEIRHFGGDLKDFVDTAGLLSNLDLVITVDTSVAHLAGAMGKPTWVLLPFSPDWRWLLEREDSPWYPSMRLFRQPRREDWDSVVSSVRQALEHNLRPQT